MSLNNLKKMIIFSNQRIKLIIENIIADEATVKKRSASSVIEKHLINDLLPQNKNASYWLQLLYDESWKISDVLDAVFAWNAAGTRGAWSSKYNNLRPLVEFAAEQSCLCNTTPSGKEQEIYHFLTQLDSVCEKFKSLSDEATNDQKKYYYKNEEKWARELLKEAIEDPRSMRYYNFYTLVLNNWDDLKDWSITFRMLSDLAALEKNLRNTEETRYELTQIMKKISAEWNE